MRLNVIPRPAARPLTLLLLGAAVLLPASGAEAQPRGRIALTPAVDYVVPGSYYARDFDAGRSAGEVRIRQQSLTMPGAQLAFELPGARWRLGLGYARGESYLRVHHYLQQGESSPPGGPPSSVAQFQSRYAFPATRELLTLSATRTLVSGRLGYELGAALMQQRLHATVYRGFLSFEEVEGRYTDWGIQLGGAAGPSSGWARGLRVGARAHVLRTSPELYDVFRSRSSEPKGDATIETALAASLGWRLTF